MMKGIATTILYPLSCTRRLSHTPIVLSLIDLKLAIKKRWANFKIVRIWFLPIFIKSQSTAWIFSFVLSAPLPTWRNLFSASGIFCGGKYQQAALGSSDQLKVPANLSLFLKSEKIPTLLYVGKRKEYRPFPDFWPVPLAYRPRAQICFRHLKFRWRF